MKLLGRFFTLIILFASVDPELKENKCFQISNSNSQLTINQEKNNEPPTYLFAYKALTFSNTFK